MNPEYLNALVTFVVGLIALVVYWLTKRAERQNAAIVVVMDIRHAEQIVLTLLEKGTVDKSMGAVLTENNWAKYKHLFARDFSSDDFSAFNRFFASCVEIEDARRMLVQAFYTNIQGKVSATQALLIGIQSDPKSDADSKAKRDTIIARANTEDYAFEPEEPKIRVIRALQLMGRLTNTVAFEKLKRIAKIDA